MNNIFSAEFSEVRNINGSNIPVIVGQERLRERIRKEHEGLSMGEILFFAKSSDITLIKEQAIWYENRLYTVIDVSESMSGILEIVISSASGV